MCINNNTPTDASIQGPQGQDQGQGLRSQGQGQGLTSLR